MRKQKVEFIRQPGKYRLGYFPGDRAEFDEKQAREMAKAGIVTIIEKESEPDLPKDLPGREALVKAGISYEDLLKIENYEEIEGVGKATASKLKEYFKTKK